MIAYVIYVKSNIRWWTSWQCATVIVGSLERAIEIAQSLHMRTIIFENKNYDLYPEHFYFFKPKGSIVFQENP